METGFVAFLDALGFKGIWRDPAHPPEAVLAALQDLQARATEELSWPPAGGADVEPPDDQSDPLAFGVSVRTAALPSRFAAVGLRSAVIFLSDSMFVCTSYAARASAGTPATKVDDPEDLTRRLDADVDQALALIYNLWSVCRILQMASRGDPVFAYRGCIAAGAFRTEEHFLVGPAVDEAAELAAHADGAFVWLAPSASIALNRMRDVDQLTPFYLEGNLPLKGGATYRCPIINPLALLPGEERAVMSERLLRSFQRGGGSQRLDVEIKRQRTEQFLAPLVARSHS